MMATPTTPMIAWIRGSSPSAGMGLCRPRLRTVTIIIRSLRPVSMVKPSVWFVPLSAPRCPERSPIAAMGRWIRRIRSSVMMGTPAMVITVQRIVSRFLVPAVTGPCRIMKSAMTATPRVVITAQRIVRLSLVLVATTRFRVVKPVMMAISTGVIIVRRIV